MVLFVQTKYLIFLTMLLFSSCMTYRWEAKVPVEVTTKKSTPTKPRPNNVIPKFVTVEALAKHSKILGNRFSVKNNSDEMVYVSYKNSVIEFLGSSYRVISGETIGINKDRDSADTPIAPNSTADISLFTQDDIISSQMKTDPKLFTYRIAFRREGKKTEYAIIYPDRKDDPSEDVTTDVNSFTTEVASKDKLLCFATAVFYGGWCWFIAPSDTDILEAEKTGKKLFGPNTTIRFLDRE